MKPEITTNYFSVLRDGEDDKPARAAAAATLPPPRRCTMQLTSAFIEPGREIIQRARGTLRAREVFEAIVCASLSTMESLLMSEFATAVNAGQLTTPEAAIGFRAVLDLAAASLAESRKSGEAMLIEICQDVEAERAAAGGSK